MITFVAGDVTGHWLVVSSRPWLSIQVGIIIPYSLDYNKYQCPCP